MLNYSTTPWAPTGLNLSNTPRPIRSYCAACLKKWVSRNGKTPQQECDPAFPG